MLRVRVRGLAFDCILMVVAHVMAIVVVLATVIVVRERKRKRLMER